MGTSGSKGVGAEEGSGNQGNKNKCNNIMQFLLQVYCNTLDYAVRDLFFWTEY